MNPVHPAPSPDLATENARLRAAFAAIFAVADETLAEEFVRLRCVWCNELILADDQPGLLAAARTHDTTCGKNPSVIARQLAEQRLADARAYAVCDGHRGHGEQPCGWAGRGVHVVGLFDRSVYDVLDHGCPACGGAVALYNNEPAGVSTLAQAAPAPVDGPDIWPLVMEDLRKLRDVATHFPIVKDRGLDVAIDTAIEDMQARHVVGQQRYGRPLRAFNGRDALVEMYQELLDAVVYARQAKAEGLLPPETRIPQEIMGVLLATRVLITKVATKRGAAAAQEG